MIKVIFFFILVGFVEIGGGYLIWQWQCEGVLSWLGFLGGIVLVLYGVIVMWQLFLDFGCVYVVYGGIFIVLSLFWVWWVDKKMFDIYDWIGGFVCLIGVVVMFWLRS